MIMSPDLLDIYAGKILTLMCITLDHDAFGPPNEVQWSVNGSKVDFTTHRGGINIQTVKRSLSTTSKLTILNIRHADAGNYECSNLWTEKTVSSVTKY